ncbi:MAG TPA: hypothetical protein VL971_10825 [Rhizomicrobium sp.]|nr:hypothetical protein [Rhizomicrobium sp.]
MPRVSAAFFAVGILCVLAGMALGMRMGATDNMTLAPAHAHLNLVGWVTMALYGTFYALEGPTIVKRLAWANFIVSTIGILVMIPALAMFLLGGNDPEWVPMMSAGEGIVALGALIFAMSVFRELFRRRA